MGKFYFAFTWHKIVNLHVCICKNEICIWSDPGVNLPICKYTPVCICVRMRHLFTPSKICTPEYIYTRVFLVHANWTKVLSCCCLLIYMTASLTLSSLMRKPKMWFPNRSDTNQAVQSQMVSDLRRSGGVLSM